MIEVHLAWLRMLGVPRERLRCAVQIHETADVAAAERFWAALVGIDPADLLKTTLKKHQPHTNRKNRGGSYRGCLRIEVLGAADLYRRIEGAWYGIVGAVDTPDRTYRA